MFIKAFFFVILYIVAVFDITALIYFAFGAAHIRVHFINTAYALSAPYLLILRSLGILPILFIASSSSIVAITSAGLTLRTFLVLVLTHIIIAVIACFVIFTIIVAREAKRTFVNILQAFTVNIHPYPSVIHPADDEYHRVFMDMIFTYKIMDDPVVASDGFTYERVSIQKWFGMGKKTSPTTGAVLSNKNLITNNSLRSVINDLKSAANVVCAVNN
jgi:hypothetical protein